MASPAGPIIGLLAVTALLFATIGKEKKGEAKMLPPPSGPPDLPGAVDVQMSPGSIWKVVGYTDPGVRLKSDVFASVLDSMGHKMLKFIITGEQGFGYTVQIGASGMHLKVPSYDPPIHITSAQQSSASNA